MVKPNGGGIYQSHQTSWVKIPSVSSPISIRMNDNDKIDYFVVKDIEMIAMIIRRCDGKFKVLISMILD